MIESASSTPGLRPSRDGNSGGKSSRQRALTSGPPPRISLADDGDQPMSDAPIG